MSKTPVKVSLGEEFEGRGITEVFWEEVPEGQRWSCFRERKSFSQSRRGKQAPAVGWWWFVRMGVKIRVIQKADTSTEVLKKDPKVYLREWI